MPLRLTVTEGPCAGLSYFFERAGTFLVGRSAKAQFQFPSGANGDPRVSHIHCLIETDPPRCRVTDLNSHNGTFVNGERVTTAELEHADRLRIGRSVLLVELEGSSDEESVGLAGTIAAPPPPAERPSSKARKPICPTCLAKRDGPGTLCASCEALAAARPQPVTGYRLVREIGSGGMGVVHLALDEQTGDAVALKTIVTGSAAPARLGRFVREADILKRLRHKHIVPFRDVGAGHGLLYLAMDLVRGTDAARLVQQDGPFSVNAAVRIVCQVLSALHYAHGLGFVHRDVKPANVLIDTGSGKKSVKVADFGLARAYLDARVSGLTLPGDVGGTTAFMAPEQVLDYRSATPAADQYSAAATLYNLLSGEFVYDQPPGVSDQLAQILDEDPVPLRERVPGLPTKLLTAVHRALARDPKRRFADVGDFRKALKVFAITE